MRFAIASVWPLVVVQLVFGGFAAAAEKTAKVYSQWPFSSDEAQRRQKETAEAIGQPVELPLALGKEGPTIVWRLIPAGKFIMGSPASEPGHEGDEELHAETIAQPFYMMETQLTVEQYRALMNADPAEGAKENDPKLPAGILYRDAVDKVLPALAKTAPGGWKVILPEQARLEYAARAGAATMNPGGAKITDAAAYAWTRENSEKKVHAVGQKLPNGWGLYDVIGNRWHWFWRGEKGYGDASTREHAVYGGSYKTEASGNGARLANIMISSGAEGVRFALIRADEAAPKGHPETGRNGK